MLGATALSMVGNALTFVAIPWFVLQTTGSAARMGLVGGAITLAAVLAGLFGGPIVDRLGFGRTSVLADLTSGAAVAARSRCSTGRSAWPSGNCSCSSSSGQSWTRRA